MLQMGSVRFQRGSESVWFEMFEEVHKFGSTWIFDFVDVCIWKQRNDCVKLNNNKVSYDPIIASKSDVTRNWHSLTLFLIDFRFEPGVVQTNASLIAFFSSLYTLDTFVTDYDLHSIPCSLFSSRIFEKNKFLCEYVEFIYEIMNDCEYLAWIRMVNILLQNEHRCSHFWMSNSWIMKHRKKSMILSL